MTLSTWTEGRSGAVQLQLGLQSQDAAAPASRPHFLSAVSRSLRKILPSISFSHDSFMDRLPSVHVSPLQKLLKIHRHLRGRHYFTHQLMSCLYLPMTTANKSSALGCTIIATHQIIFRVGKNKKKQKKKNNHMKEGRF